jgi:hypothetical protein
MLQPSTLAPLHLRQPDRYLRLRQKCVDKLAILGEALAKVRTGRPHVAMMRPSDRVDAARQKGVGGSEAGDVPKFICCLAGPAGPLSRGVTELLRR